MSPASPRAARLWLVCSASVDFPESIGPVKNVSEATGRSSHVDAEIDAEVGAGVRLRSGRLGLFGAMAQNGVGAAPTRPRNVAREARLVRAEAFVHRDGTGTFAVNSGPVELIAAGTPAAARQLVLDRALEVARDTGSTVELEVLILGQRVTVEIAPGDSWVDGASEAAATELFLAGARPVEVVDADTLAATRLRLVEAVAGEPVARHGLIGGPETLSPAVVVLPS